MSNKKEKIVSYSIDEMEKMHKQGKDKTNWNAVLSTSEDKVDDSDFDWTNAKVIFPKTNKRKISMYLDEDIYEWFKKNSQGRGYQTSMNAVLRSYINAHLR